VFDLQSAQICMQDQVLALPSSGSISEDTSTRLGITDASSAQALDVVVAQIDEMIYKQFTLTNKSFVFVTAGEWGLKWCLRADATKKEVALAPYYSAYFDLQTSFQTAIPGYRPSGPPVPSMGKHLGYRADYDTMGGIQKCEFMCKIVSHLLNVGYVFTTPEQIPADFDATRKPSALSYDASDVVRLRGLPWQATEKDIKDWMHAFAITKVHLVTNWSGRATGEAFVELISGQGPQAVEMMHRGAMGHRYVEVFSSNQEEFDAMLAKSRGEDVGGESNIGSSSYSGILKARGLPFNTSTQEICAFFNTTPIGPDNVHIVTAMDGRATGEAFIEFSSESEARQAMMDRNKERLGHRYVELFASSRGEMNNVIAAKSGAGRDPPAL